MHTATVVAPRFSFTPYIRDMNPVHLKYALALAYLQNKEMNIALFLRNIYLGFKTYKN